MNTSKKGRPCLFHMISLKLLSSYRLSWGIEAVSANDNKSELWIKLSFEDLCTISNTDIKYIWKFRILLLLMSVWAELYLMLFEVKHLWRRRVGPGETERGNIWHLKVRLVSLWDTWSNLLLRKAYSSVEDQKKMDRIRNTSL